MNSDTRIYRVYEDGAEAENLEFKGLATKEKEIVTSTIDMTEEFQARIDAEDSDSDFSRFAFKVGEPLTEDDLIAYAQQPKTLLLWVVKITSDEEVVIYDPS